MKIETNANIGNSRLTRISSIFLEIETIAKFRNFGIFETNANWWVLDKNRDYCDSRLMRKHQNIKFETIAKVENSRLLYDTPNRVFLVPSILLDQRSRMYISIFLKNFEKKSSNSIQEGN